MFSRRIDWHLLDHWFIKTDYIEAPCFYWSKYNDNDGHAYDCAYFYLGMLFTNIFFCYSITIYKHFRSDNDLCFDDCRKSSNHVSLQSLHTIFDWKISKVSNQNDVPTHLTIFLRKYSLKLNSQLRNSRELCNYSVVYKRHINWSTHSIQQLLHIPYKFSQC